jgi:hypothetical protein
MRIINDLRNLGEDIYAKNVTENYEFRHCVKVMKNISVKKKITLNILDYVVKSGMIDLKSLRINS